MIIGCDLDIAVVAVPQQMGDAGHTTGDGPELLGGRATKDGVPVDLASLDQPHQCLVAAAGLKGPHEIPDEPRPHIVVGGLPAEFVIQTAAIPAVIFQRLRNSAKWTYDNFRLGHHVLSDI